MTANFFASKGAEKLVPNKFTVTSPDLEKLERPDNSTGVAL